MGKFQKLIKMFRPPEKIITFADKNNNMYRLSKDQYKTLLSNSTISTCKKANNNIKKNTSLNERNNLKYKGEKD